MKVVLICAVAALLQFAGCASPKATHSNEAPSGTWSGDYGPDPDRRDPVTLELTWENTTLRGTVHAGPRSFELMNASFKPDTGAITMEFQAAANGRAVHYVIDGKVDGNQMKGTWGHDDVKGDFRLTRQ